MSKNWVADIAKMHKKFGVNEAVQNMTPVQLQEFLKFRIRFLEEELTEAKEQLDNPEEVVDAMIDLCVVAIGTLDAFGVDAEKAWNAVHKANMAMVFGIKEGRQNPFGLPDLTKPEGWVAPSHEGNHGFVPVTEPMVAKKGLLNKLFG